MKIQSISRFVLTALVVLAAAAVAHALWKRYMYSPWTRDARVRADVVRIAPDVSGIVTTVAVRDNQEVRKGDVLFAIDQERFRYALEQAEATLAAAEAAARAAGASSDATDAAIAARRADYQKAAGQSERRQKMSNNVISAEMRADAAATASSARASLHQAEATHHQATASREQAVAAVQQAAAALARAKLELERTEVRAPVDGYVTNLDVHSGDYAAAGAARLALIDRNSYWIYGYFEETKLPYVHVGDDVEIRLMAGGARLHGRVESIARGIGDVDNPTGANLLANVAPTFSWVRLAQRVPVRIAIDLEHLPKDLTLAAGMTATVVLTPVQQR
ncbi:HlyD family secretion protein [Dokdonella sp.]|uniref:biotin/lipoyl-binding protein n=1 Tax=Dokdonella sp. TaxID=2291710 RepID=UPI001AFFE6FE|nr:HlyD family secretion protein [Dokdonella sp.]MBO9664499.1 HlyD family secretion protein [Dokdonella sp.]